MRHSNDRILCGILNINKPAGITSRDVVNAVSRSCKGVKVGHAGTLDPIATGVLVVGLGQATRLVEYVQRMTKTYRATIRLGVTSDTLDVEGNVVPVESASPVGIAQVRSAVAAQAGPIEQVPPQYSALKVAGRRAYEFARAGRPVELRPRKVTIHRIDVINYEWPLLEADVECSSGTYIRSIARDIGAQLGCGGIVERLTRTRIGHFVLEDAIALEAIQPSTLASLLRSPEEAVRALPRIELSRPEVSAVVQGQPIQVDPTRAATLPCGEVAMSDEAGELVGIAAFDPCKGSLAPTRVLARGPQSCAPLPES
jgi:tRNA pseudouridine55 synthase